MMRDNKKANARRERDGRSATDDDGLEAFSEEVACVVCGAAFPSNQMFFGDEGQVCAEHFEG
jgi:hypothetical protein